MVNITATTKTEADEDTQVPLEATRIVEPKGEPFRGRKPSDWTLTPVEDGSVEASNGVTGEFFTGTIEAFNARLRASN